MRKLEPEEKQFLDKLYREQYKSLLDYARMFLDESSAQEAVQNVFRDACVKIEDVMSSENAVGWLVNALKFSISKIKRKKEQFARVMVLMSSYVDEADNGGKPKNSIEDLPDPNPPDEDVDFLYSDLALHKEFQFIKEYAVENKSIKEIADEHGISINACKQKLYRCRLKLRKLWDKQNKNN